MPLFPITFTDPHISQIGIPNPTLATDVIDDLPFEGDDLNEIHEDDDDYSDSSSSSQSAIVTKHYHVPIIMVPGKSGHGDTLHNLSAILQSKLREAVPAGEIVSDQDGYYPIYTYYHPSIVPYEKASPREDQKQSKLTLQALALADECCRILDKNTSPYVLIGVDSYGSALAVLAGRILQSRKQAVCVFCVNGVSPLKMKRFLTSGSMHASNELFQDVCHAALMSAKRNLDLEVIEIEDEGNKKKLLSFISKLDSAMQRQIYDKLKQLSDSCQLIETDITTQSSSLFTSEKIDKLRSFSADAQIEMLTEPVHSILVERLNKTAFLILAEKNGIENVLKMHNLSGSQRSSLEMQCLEKKILLHCLSYLIEDMTKAFLTFINVLKNNVKNACAYVPDKHVDNTLDEVSHLIPHQTILALKESCSSTTASSTSQMLSVMGDDDVAGWQAYAKSSNINGVIWRTSNNGSYVRDNTSSVNIGLAPVIQRLTQLAPGALLQPGNVEDLAKVICASLAVTLQPDVFYAMRAEMKSRLFPEQFGDAGSLGSLTSRSTTPPSSLEKSSPAMAHRKRAGSQTTSDQSGNVSLVTTIAGHSGVTTESRNSYGSSCGSVSSSSPRQ